MQLHAYTLTLGLSDVLSPQGEGAVAPANEGTGNTFPGQGEDAAAAAAPTPTVIEGWPWYGVLEGQVRKLSTFERLHSWILTFETPCKHIHSQIFSPV